MVCKHTVTSDLEGNRAVAAHPDFPDAKPEIILIPRSVQTTHLRTKEGLPIIPVDYIGNVDHMAYDDSGNLYIAELRRSGPAPQMHLMRMTSGRSVTTPFSGVLNGNGSASPSYIPMASIGINKDGTVFFTDPSSHGVYRLNASNQPFLVVGEPGESGNLE
jgi:hypothetical protein